MDVSVESLAIAMGVDTSYFTKMTDDEKEARAEAFHEWFQERKEPFLQEQAELAANEEPDFNEQEPDEYEPEEPDPEEYEPEEPEPEDNEPDPEDLIEDEEPDGPSESEVREAIHVRAEFERWYLDLTTKKGELV